jgi:hypothetical protein
MIAATDATKTATTKKAISTRRESIAWWDRGVTRGLLVRFTAPMKRLAV